MGYICPHGLHLRKRNCGSTSIPSARFQRPSLLISTSALSRRIPRASDMRRMTIVAIATMLATASAFGQGAGSTAPLPAKPVTAAPAGAANPAHVTSAKPAAAVSTPESRSAAALALSHEPTFDEGTAQRIREAALSYSDLAVRGGWPVLPAEAKFASGPQGPHADLLRQRLLISGDLDPDKASGAYDDVLAESVKRFQARHGLA